MPVVLTNGEARTAPAELAQSSSKRPRSLNSDESQGATKKIREEEKKQRRRKKRRKVSVTSANAIQEPGDRATSPKSFKSDHNPTGEHFEAGEHFEMRSSSGASGKIANGSQSREGLGQVRSQSDTVALARD